MGYFTIDYCKVPGVILLNRCTWWCFLIRKQHGKELQASSELSAPSTSSGLITTTDWKLCIICQEEKAEALTCPSKSKRKDVGSV